MEFNEVIRIREAVRKFDSDKEISEDILTNVLEAGRIAPTAKNQQPQKILVVKSAEGLEKIDMASPCRYGAPVVLLVCGDKSKEYTNKKDGHTTLEMDCCIAATHMMLAATNKGLGNIWIELFDRNVIRQEFNLPEDLEPIMLLPIGFKAEDCPASPLHNVRNDLNTMVEYL